MTSKQKPLKVFPEFANMIKANAAIKGKSVIKYTEELCAKAKTSRGGNIPEWDFNF